MDIYLERFVNDVMDRQVHRNGIFGQRMRKLTRTLLDALRCATVAPTGSAAARG